MITLVTPKRLVTVIALVLMVCSATVITSYIVMIGRDSIVPQGIRFALTCLLCFSLLLRWNLGRWITIVMIGIDGIASVLLGIGLMTRSPSGILVLGLGLVDLACVCGLLTPTAKAHFR